MCENYGTQVTYNFVKCFLTITNSFLLHWAIILNVSIIIPTHKTYCFFTPSLANIPLLVWPLRSRDWWHDRSMKSPCKSRATPQATRKNEDEAEGNDMSCDPNFITGLVYNYMCANWMSKMSEHPWSNRLHPCIWQTQLCQYFSRRTTCSQSSSRRVYRERRPSGQQKPITVPSSAEQSWTYLPRCIQ